ncbi:MAG: CBS domain-containing protein [Nitrosopumilaceae archaeon]
MVFIPKLQEIKQRREELNISQRQLAKLCDIRPSFLNMIENGKAKPSYDVFVNLFEVLDEQAEKNTEHLKTASKICAKNVMTATRHESLEDIIKIMKTKNYSQIPVVDSSGCLGLITENSILKYQLEYGRDSLSKAKSVDAMETPPPIIDWNQPVTQRILDLLYDAKCLLVSQDGRIKGIIAKIDAIKERKK